MAIGTEEMVLTDEQIERIAERAADIVAERQRKAARLFNADVRERGFEAVMVEGIQALRAEADRSEAR